MNLPCALIVEKPVGALLELFGDVLRLLMSLKPCLILFVEAPALVLKGFSSQILLIRPLSVIEQIEEGIRVDTAGIIQPGVIEDGKGLLRVVEGGVVWILRLIMPRLFRIPSLRTCCEGGSQESLNRWGRVGGCTLLGHFERLDQIL